MRISCKNVTLTHLAIRQAKNVSSVNLLRIVVNNHTIPNSLSTYTFGVLTAILTVSESSQKNESGTNQQLGTNQERIMKVERIRNKERIMNLERIRNTRKNLPDPLQWKLGIDPTSGNMVD
jgi:hypothetical protein